MYIALIVSTNIMILHKTNAVLQDNRTKIMQKLSADMENIRKHFSLYIILNILIRLSSTKNKRRTAI